MRDKTLLNRPQLGLRNSTHQVQVIVPNGSNQAVLGTRHPDHDNRRAETMAQAGGARSSPRQQEPAAIELPLPIRTQTALNHRLPPEVQARVNGGIATQEKSRRDNGNEKTEFLE